MQQRNDSLLSVEPANLLDLPDEVLCHEVLPKLGVNSLIALESVNHRIKALLPKVWQAKHALYFPRANQATVKWLLEYGETWFSIFMNDYHNQRELRRYERLFKGSCINDVIDCILRGDRDGLMMLDIDWRQFYTWLTTPAPENPKLTVLSDYYLIQLIGKSSDDVRRYIYCNLKMIVEGDASGILDKSNVEWLLSVICHQPLPLVGEQGAERFIRNISMTDTLKIPLIQLAILARNAELVREIFSWAYSLNNRQGQNILCSGLMNIVPADFIDSSKADFTTYIQWARQIGQAFGRSYNVIFYQWILSEGRNGNIELITKLCDILLSDAEDGFIIKLLVKELKFNGAALMALYKRYNIDFSMEELLDLSRSALRSGAYEMVELLSEQGVEMYYSDNKLISKLFRNACIDINNIKFLLFYLTSRIARNNEFGELSYNWVDNCRKILSSGVSVNPKSLLKCLTSMLELNQGDLVQCGDLAIIVREIQLSYKAERREQYLVLLKTLYDYRDANSFSHTTFFMELCKCLNPENSDQVLDILFHVIAIPVGERESILNKLEYFKRKSEYSSLPRAADPFFSLNAALKLYVIDGIIERVRQHLGQAASSEALPGQRSSFSV